MQLPTLLFLLMLGGWFSDANVEQPKCGLVAARGATPRVSGEHQFSWSECGERIRLTSNALQIIGGYQSEEFNWPFLAYLRIEYSLSVGNKTIQKLAAQCTSTILSGQYLLTAAHCFHAKAGNAM